MSNKAKQDYKLHVRRRLSYLSNIFALASIGDFSRDLKIPRNEEEFTDLYVGIQVMIDVIREKITELRQEKTQLETEKDQLQTLIDNLPVGVIIVEAPSAKPVVINRKAMELLGRKIIVGKHNRPYMEYYQVYKENGEVYAQHERPLLVSLREKRKIVRSDFVVRHPNGREVSLKVQCVPVFNKRGKIISAIEVLDDITKQKELDKVKTQFVSVASHQLRTPLGTMRWNLEMLINGDYGEMSSEIGDVIRDIYDSNRRLITLVNSLLNVSRISEGRDFDEAQEVGLLPIIKSTIHVLDPIAKKKGITIKLNVGGNVLPIKADKTKLESIVMNLMSNAVKYNFDGGLVEVDLSSDKKFVVLKVRDTGVGIGDKDKDKIFTKFYRTEDAIKFEAEGSGLGLFVVKSYVESWGGRVSFKSKHGKGSEFAVRIPKAAKLNISKKRNLK